MENRAKGGRQFETLMLPAEVAELLGVRPQTLTAWRHRHRGGKLPYVKIGRMVRYRAADVERFIKTRTVGVLREGAR